MRSIAQRPGRGFASLDLTLGTVAEDVVDLMEERAVAPPIIAPLKARQRHMHIVGSNGSGKSRFMRTLIQQDIREGRGLCLIDPHGTQCEDVLKWLAKGRGATTSLSNACGAA